MAMVLWPSKKCWLQKRICRLWNTGWHKEGMGQGLFYMFYWLCCTFEGCYRNQVRNGTSTIKICTIYYPFLVAFPHNGHAAIWSDSKKRPNRTLSRTEKQIKAMEQIHRPLRAIHVDDDPRAIRHLKGLLGGMEDIVYLNGFFSATKALDFLGKEEVDLVFLDVEMKGNKGVWLAEQVRDMKVGTVFIAGSASYAVQAFKAGALDYLLRPMGEGKLRVMLERLHHAPPQSFAIQQGQRLALSSHLGTKQGPDRIFVNTIGKVTVVKPEAILYLSSNNNYTAINMKNGDRHMSSKTMTLYEDALKQSPDFLRVSRSHIINLNYLSSIQRNTKTAQITVQMENGDELGTSYKTKEEIMNFLST